MIEREQMNSARTDEGARRYPDLSPFETGWRGQCPRCGQGRLFSGFLTTRESCSNCGLDFKFEDSGDGPAVFIMMFVGFLIVGSALFVEVTWQPPIWLHMIIWLPLTIGVALALLRPLKGLMIAQQYKHDAQEGSLEE